MGNFFDKNLLQGIISGIIVLLISIWLGGQVKTSPHSGKRWKIVVIVAYAMILGGFYMFGLNVPNGGLHNPYTSIGLSLVVLGFAIKYIGKFFIWWHR